MSRAIRPVFTEAQTKAIRVALRGALEDEWLPPGRATSLVNALRQLDAADSESARRAKVAA